MINRSLAQHRRYDVGLYVGGRGHGFVGQVYGRDGTRHHTDANALSLLFLFCIYAHTLACAHPAFGAPLVYADQAWSIQKRRSSEGFSMDVCAVLLIANICRVFFWFGERFELALLLQSILMIVSQLFLLSLLIRFRPGSFASSAYSVASNDRPNQTGGTESAPVASSVPTAAERSEFSADEAFDGPNESSGSGDNAAKTTFPPSAGGLFSSAPSGGRYAPLFGLNLPPPPTLGLEEGEDEDAGTGSSSARQKLNRVGRKTVRFLQAGLKRSEGTKRLDGSSGGRVFGFWTWPDYSSYLLFLGALIAVLTVLQLLLGRLETYVWLLGMLALGLESTLPVPQALQNYRRRSLSGFRLSVLLGWLVGDAFKSVYFIAQSSPIQFTISGLFALSVDLVICAQLYLFREQTARDEENQRASQAEEMETGRRRQAPIEDSGSTSAPPIHANSAASKAAAAKASAATPRGKADFEPSESSPFQIEADEDDEEDDEGDMGKLRR